MLRLRIFDYCSIYATISVADGPAGGTRGGKKKRFTLDLDPEVQLRLKVAAALRGISMRRYCLDAIEKELVRDEIAQSGTQPLSEEALNKLDSLRKEIFGGRILPGDSAELIREARDQRTKDLERLSGGSRQRSGQVAGGGGK